MAQLTSKTRALFHEYFMIPHQSSTKRTLRARIHPIQRELGAFQSNRKLGSVLMRVPISVDLVDGIRIIWSGQSTRALDMSRLVGDPRRNLLLQEDTIERQIEIAVESLASAYRRTCAENHPEENGQ